MRFYQALFMNGDKKTLLIIIISTIILAVSYFSSGIYFTLEMNSIEEQKALIDSMFIMNQKIAETKGILNRYASALSEIDTMDMLNTELNSLAKGSGFYIGSLTVEREGGKDKRVAKTQTPALAVTSFKVALKGSGTLNSVINFLNEVYASDRLFAVETMKISVANVSSKNNYNVEFIFSYYTI